MDLLVRRGVGESSSGHRRMVGCCDKNNKLKVCLFQIFFLTLHREVIFIEIITYQLWEKLIIEYYL